MSLRPDDFDEPGPRELPPLDLAPMEPLDGPPPSPLDRRWVYQTSTPGKRCVVHINGALVGIGMLPRVRTVSDTGRDLSELFPELDTLAEVDDDRPFSIDGVLHVTHSEHHKGGLQYRLAASGRADALLRAREVPAELVVRDLIHLDGRRVGDQPYAARRFLLSTRLTPGPSWAIPSDELDPAPALLAGSHIVDQVPHLLSRRLDSRYFPGMASRAWLRTAYPILRRVPILGWMDDRPEAGEHIDAVLIAATGPVARGRRAVQAVRSGLTMATRDRLSHVLEQLPVSGYPQHLRFEHDDAGTVRWARPGAAGTFLATAISPEGLLEHPVLLSTHEAR